MVKGLGKVISINASTNQIATQKLRLKPRVKTVGSLGGFDTEDLGILGCFIPIGSMYGIFTHIYHEFMVNVGK